MPQNGKKLIFGAPLFKCLLLQSSFDSSYVIFFLAIGNFKVIELIHILKMSQIIVSNKRKAFSILALVYFFHLLEERRREKEGISGPPKVE